MVTHFSERQLAGLECIWCARTAKRMVPCGWLGTSQLFRCFPDCEEPMPVPTAPERHLDDVIGDYLERGWSLDEAGHWHKP